LLTLIGIASGPAAWALDQTAPVITAASTTVGPVQFEAIWPDGTRLQAVDVEGWRGDGRGAKIGGRSLFVAPMVRTLRNLSIPARLPGGPFVEFIQGDILPAQVTGTATGESALDDAVLLIRPHESLDLPGLDGRDALQLGAAWVRRLVWARTARRDFRPGTAFYRDQKSQSFQRLKFEPRGVHLLADDKVIQVDWGDLEELHFPAADGWLQHTREQAILCPDVQTSLLRLTTASGMRLTASLDRLHTWSLAQEATRKDTFHFVQPAWSVDVLCVRRDQVREYSLLPPLEVPLSAIEPVRSAHSAVFSRAFSHWTRDGSVLGEPLVSGGREYAWGFGMFGGHELEFPLHPAAARLRMGVGLDGAAGAGGCLRGRIELLSSEPEAARALAVHESQIVVGAARPIEPISVDLPASKAASRIRLVADPVLDCPPNADPYDIRDYCDWLEPCVELRKEPWTAAVSAALPASYPALRGWTLDGLAGRDWRPITVWDATTRPYPSFHRAWILPGFPLTLSREVAVPNSRTTKWNVHIRRSRAAEPACRLDVAVNDRRVGRFAVPEPAADGPTRPFVIDFEPFAGREVRIELRLVPLAGETCVVWGGAEFELP
jgi:hypothetical protein